MPPGMHVGQEATSGARISTCCWQQLTEAAILHPAGWACHLRQWPYLTGDLVDGQKVQ